MLAPKKEVTKSLCPSKGAAKNKMRPTTKTNFAKAAYKKCVV